jgi:hypothetical protein
MMDRSENYPGMMITDTANFRYDAYHCANGQKDVVENLNMELATKVVKATLGSVMRDLQR